MQGYNLEIKHIPRINALELLILLLAVKLSKHNHQCSYMNEVPKLHGIQLIVYTDRGARFTSKFRRDIWGLFGTQLQYSTAYHPQTQGLVGRINVVIVQILRCKLMQMNEIKNWVKIFPTVELVINSLPNKGRGYSPFFLNYGYHNHISWWFTAEEKRN